LKSIYNILFLLCLATFGYSQETLLSDDIIRSVNEIRSKGCYCGNEYLKPVGPLQWDYTLFSSARDHARDMYENNYFSHISRSGKDIGDRLDEFGYRWQLAGENLGEGQRDFKQLLQEWIDSPSHCKMLMHEEMKDMAVAKIGKYWVQHFGKLLPHNSKRVNQRYVESR